MQPEKKPFGGGFFLFLAAVLIGAYALQSYFETKVARVGFSHQVEHLVNLDLIRPDESRKTATTGNLVSFSGRFRDRLTEESRQRYRYIDLLHQEHQLEAQQQEIQAQMQQTRNKILSSANLFVQIAGIDLPKTGYPIVSSYYDQEDQDWSVVLTELKNENIVSIAQLKALKKEVISNHEDWKNVLIVCREWVSYFASTQLGISSEELKKQIKHQLQELSHVSSREDFLELFPKLLDIGEQWIAALEKSDDHIRLTQTRAVREYRQEIQQALYLKSALDQLQLQLTKARRDIQGSIWYFNNEENSIQQLEKQSPEVFEHWFKRAKVEWDRFGFNKGAYFKATDQPNYAVLEKTFRSEEAPPNYMGLLFTMLPVIMVVLLIYFVFARQMKGVGSSAMNFAKSPAKLLQKGTHKVTFNDVAGIEEAKEELQEIVDFLKQPEKFTQLGAEIPKGVLCVGPPGTGKTLIAKAVAGEADRPFFSISGSDFVEMFVGVGASRIRDMFKEAKKQAPCIIFMDEIDAVGRHRGAGVGGGHDEREQTLNQLLVEMDGFDANEGIILMAATNRPDVLDKALLRPGRFDRRVVIDLPDIKGRLEILKIHARKIMLDEDVDLSHIARATPGCSGADLKNILNEAALWAVRSGKESVSQSDIAYAADKVRYGKERRSFEMTEEEIKRTAYHEAGHAIISMALEYCDPVDKVTVIPRGMALGATYTLPKGNRVGYWKKELYELITMILGGRAAEEVFIGDMSSGASSDIQRATSLARSMICEWGMSEKLGMVAYDERGEQQYLHSEGAKNKAYSEKIAQEIDHEVQIIIHDCHKKAIEMMGEYTEQVELMAKMLIRFESLDHEDVVKIMELDFDPDLKELKVAKSKDKGSSTESEDSEKKEKSEEEVKDVSQKDMKNVDESASSD